MVSGEKAVIKCSAAYLQGFTRETETPVLFTVHLQYWRPAPAGDGPALNFGLVGDAALEEAGNMKARGAQFFKAQLWDEARHDFSQAVRTVLSATELPEARKAEEGEMVLSCWLNEALCGLKLEDWEAANHASTRVLTGTDTDKSPMGMLMRMSAMKSDYASSRTPAVEAKALYRRGWARIEMSECALNLPQRTDLEALLSY